MTSVELGLSGVLLVVGLLVLSGWLSLLSECSTDRKERMKPTGAGGFLWE